ncbi:unnamed protein product [Rhizophagus irregularis]|uniref:Uncharacterized protein n=1 Tax=Rhizophagus irregularis TaxID=588596 RepID=A0A915Z7U4_9GLOM|nr:unnamed protein product [Rhizophagus irregularis]
MTSEKDSHNLCYANYWKRSYTQWRIDTWDQFFFKEFPNASKQISHTALGLELETLIKNLEPKTRKKRKALDLKCQLKGRRASSQNEFTHPLRRAQTSYGISLIKKYGREINEEKENETVTPVKRKAIEKDKFSKKSKKNEKGKEQLEADEESFVVSTSISFNYSSISKIYLSEIVQNIIPNLNNVFPDEITNWLDFKQEVQKWQPESNKKYYKPIFRLRNITCEKDIWSATDANIFDTLTSLEQPIYFLDGCALKNIVGEPDFVIVLSNQNIVTLYNNEKEVREGPYAYSGDVTVYHPINQIYGYMCANKLIYGILSTYDQTWFLERGVVGEDHGWLHISDTITNSSTDPTLLKSVAYIIDLASKNRYAPFLEKPIMIADNVDEESDSSDKEQIGDSDFKYRGNLFPKNSNVITRKQNHQYLENSGKNLGIFPANLNNNSGE